MSRSPYYPRKRARILTRQQKQAAAAASENRPQRIRPCVVCDVDLPIIESDGLYYLQAPLGFICKALEKEVCPWKLRMENGAAEERDATLSPNRLWPEVYPS